MERDCNHCGRCCNETPCNLSLAIVLNAKRNSPCPALERHGEKYLCGLYLNQDIYINYDKVAEFDSDVRSQLINIKPLLESLFQNTCTSHFGNSDSDKRIPIHVIN